MSALLSPSTWTFLTIYVSYAVVYFCRRNYSFFVKLAGASGLCGTAFELTGSVSKVAGGYLVDRLSPSLVLSVSLLAIGLSNLGFLLPESENPRVAFWALNGFSQAFAWPALVKIFMAWFPDPSRRGTWYSVLATSQNAGAALVPFIITAPVHMYGWKAALYVPGSLCVAYSLLCWLFLRDRPQSASPCLPAAQQGAAVVAPGKGNGEASMSDKLQSLQRDKLGGSTIISSSGSSGNAENSSSGNASGLQQEKEVELRGRRRGGGAAGGGATEHVASRGSPSRAQPSSAVDATSTATHQPSSPPLSSPAALSAWGTVKLVLGSPCLWLLGANYFFNTAARNVLTDWVSVFLSSPEMQGRHGIGSGKAAAGGGGGGDLSSLVPLCLSAYELGGALGGLIAGAVSDRLFQGRRGPVLVLFSFAAAPLPVALLSVPSLLTNSTAALLGGPAVLLPALYFLLGLCFFAPHVLNGLASRELVETGVQSSAGGFTKACGQMGGAWAGVGLSAFVHSYGWAAAMQLLSLAALLSGLSALPLWYRKAYAATNVAEQQQQQQVVLLHGQPALQDAGKKSFTAEKVVAAGSTAASALQ